MRVEVLQTDELRCFGKGWTVQGGSEGLTVGWTEVERGNVEPKHHGEVKLEGEALHKIQILECLSKGNEDIKI